MITLEARIAVSLTGIPFAGLKAAVGEKTSVAHPSNSRTAPLGSRSRSVGVVGDDRVCDGALGDDADDIGGARPMCALNPIGRARAVTLEPS